MSSKPRFLSPILAVLGLLAVTGCGFTPLYGDADDPVGAQPLSQKLDQVDIQNIPERTGQMLRQSLQDQFHAAGQPTTQRYTLAVSYTISTEDIGVQEDTSVTRNRFVAAAHWSLAPIGAPGKPFASGMANTEDAANVIDQQYFALTLETNTVNQQLADTIAGQITAQVAIYFKTHPNA